MHPLSRPSPRAPAVEALDDPTAQNNDLWVKHVDNVGDQESHVKHGLLHDFPGQFVPLSQRLFDHAAGHRVASLFFHDPRNHTLSPGGDARPETAQPQLRRLSVVVSTGPDEGDPAAAERDQVRGEKRANPVLTLGGKSERPESGLSYDNAVILEVNVPLGAAGRAVLHPRRDRGAVRPRRRSFLHPARGP